MGCWMLCSRLMSTRAVGSVTAVLSITVLFITLLTIALLTIALLTICYQECAVGATATRVFSVSCDDSFAAFRKVK